MFLHERYAEDREDDELWPDIQVGVPHRPSEEHDPADDEIKAWIRGEDPGREGPYQPGTTQPR